MPRKNGTTRKPRRRGRAGQPLVLVRKQRRRREEVDNLLGRFARYLAKRRKEERMTYRDLSKRARIPYSNCYQFEELRKNPRLTELEQLAKAFEEPLTKFLEPLVTETQP